MARIIQLERDIKIKDKQISKYYKLLKYWNKREGNNLISLNEGPVEGKREEVKQRLTNTTNKKLLN